MADFASAADLTKYQDGDPDLNLAAAEALVRSYCGWHIYPSKTEDVTLNGSGRSVLFLPSLYVTAINSVSETVVWGDSTTTTALVEGTDYDWSDAGYLTRLRTYWRAAWTTKPRGVQVNMTHGYTDMPLEVQSVILSVANRGATSGGDSGVDQAGPFRYTPPSNSDGSTGGIALTPLERSTLDRYRVPL